MKAVVQRVKQAGVEVDGEVVGRIDAGLLVYLGVAKGDTPDDIEFIARKIAGLRIFEDDTGRMNRSVQDVGAAVLLVSQFTLCGDCRKGRRPSFDPAAEPKIANEYYQHVAAQIAAEGISVEKGIFAAHMHVNSVNDGPVTLILDSRS